MKAYHSFLSVYKGNYIGQEGERLIKSLLFTEGEWEFKDNAVIKNSAGAAECDFIVINEAGIFVLEVKNWGKKTSEKDRDNDVAVDENGVWYRNGRELNEKDPLVQNQTHVNVVREAVGEGIPVYNIVVFANDDIKLYIAPEYTDCVIRYTELIETIRNISKDAGAFLTEEGIAQTENKINRCITRERIFHYPNFLRSLLSGPSFILDPENRSYNQVIDYGIAAFTGVKPDGSRLNDLYVKERFVTKSSNVMLSFSSHSDIDRCRSIEGTKITYRMNRLELIVGIVGAVIIFGVFILPILIRILHWFHN